MYIFLFEKVKGSFVAKILITSAGSGVGSAILTAAQHSQRDYQFINLNSNALSASLYHCQQAYLSPPTQDRSAFIERLLAIVDSERPELLLAGRDEELVMLAAQREPLAQLGCIVPCGSVKSLQLCVDKYLTWQQMHPYLPITATASSKTEIQDLISQFGFPLFAKPRFGFAARGTQVLKSETKLWSFLESLQEPYIVQPYLQALQPGHYAPELNEYSGQILIGQQGDLLGIFASQIAVEQGLSTKILRLTSNSAFADLLKQTAQVLTKLGYRGPVNLQAIQIAPNQFSIIEFNARCTGLTGARAAMGFNELDLLYRDFVQQQVPLPLINWQAESLAVLSSHYQLLPLAQVSELQATGKLSPNNGQ